MMDKTLNVFELSEQQLEKEIRRVQYRSRQRAAVKSTVIALLVAAAVMVLAVTLWFPVLQITGNSMEPLPEDVQAVLAFRTQELARGDVVAFYQENRLLVRRVIAQAGDWVEINDAGQVSVNGEILDEPDPVGQVREPNDLTYPYQVPDGCIFVMGDQRTESADSGSAEAGCVSKDRIVGRVLFSIWPLHQLEYIG